MSTTYKEEYMNTIYHVADPVFWELWHKKGSRAWIWCSMPKLGDWRLDICFEQYAWIHDRGLLTLTGGIVTRLELIQENPPLLRITMRNALETFTVALGNGERISEAEEDPNHADNTCDIRVFGGRSKSFSGDVTVDLVFSWKKPEDVMIVIKKYRVGSEDSDTERATISMEQFKQIAREQKVLLEKPKAASKRPRIKLLANSLDSCWRPKALGPFFLPPEVKPEHFLKAVTQIIRFQSFSTKTDA